MRLICRECEQRVCGSSKDLILKFALEERPAKLKSSYIMKKDIGVDYLGDLGDVALVVASGLPTIALLAIWDRRQSTLN